MLSKKIACLLLSASVLTPAAAAAVEDFDSECVEAATNFIEPSNLSPTAASYGYCIYGIPGDVNSDGRTDLSDYTLLRRYINNDGVGININKNEADINRDGKVDFLDLLALKEFI